ncbi:MAG: cob(I)yrinic acid a,c-diamide adenosyltransferase [Candidatus Promineifilaceae bacterium]|jgi:cob(I)alamin adenosyltransferase
MPRLTKIYTGQGDAGKTRLSSGQLVNKHDLRVTSYGAVDELNSHIGLALTMNISDQLAPILSSIQNELFHLGSDLSFAAEESEQRNIPQIEARHIARLEEVIDELNAQVGPLQNFILPGGTQAAAQLHVARTVCRRAEREVSALAEQEQVGAYVMPYLNRLSDALFVMARYENKSKGIPEPLWDSRV